MGRKEGISYSYPLLLKYANIMYLSCAPSPQGISLSEILHFASVPRVNKGHVFPTP